MLNKHNTLHFVEYHKAQPLHQCMSKPPCIQSLRGAMFRPFRRTEQLDDISTYPVSIPDRERSDGAVCEATTSSTAFTQTPNLPNLEIVGHKLTYSNVTQEDLSANEANQTDVVVATVENTETKPVDENCIQSGLSSPTLSVEVNDLSDSILDDLDLPSSCNGSLADGTFVARSPPCLSISIQPSSLKMGTDCLTAEDGDDVVLAPPLLRPAIKATMESQKKVIPTTSSAMETIRKELERHKALQEIIIPLRPLTPDTLQDTQQPEKSRRFQIHRQARFVAYLVLGMMFVMWLSGVIFPGNPSASSSAAESPHQLYIPSPVGDKLQVSSPTTFSKKLSEITRCDVPDAPTRAILTKEGNAENPRSTRGNQLYPTSSEPNVDRTLDRTTGTIATAHSEITSSATPKVSARWIEQDVVSMLQHVAVLASHATGNVHVGEVRPFYWSVVVSRLMGVVHFIGEVISWIKWSIVVATIATACGVFAWLLALFISIASTTPASMTPSPPPDQLKAMDGGFAENVASMDRVGSASTPSLQTPRAPVIQLTTKSRGIAEKLEAVAWVGSAPPPTLPLNLGPYYCKLAELLRNRDTELSRRGLPCRAFPSIKSASSHATAAYECHTKQDLHSIALAVGLSGSSITKCNKADLINLIVCEYEKVLDGFTKSDIMAILSVLKVSFKSGARKKDLVKLAVETGL